MTKTKIRSIVLIALFAGLLAVCSQIMIPFTIPFTMQTFALYLAILVLGPKKSLVSVCVYILLGICGFPVFAGFKGGISTFLGPTAGFIVGFVPMVLVFWLLTSIFGKGKIVTIISLFISTLVCYLFGTLWFMYIYTFLAKAEGYALFKVLSLCVFPFIIPDLVKLLFAFAIAVKLNSILSKSQQCLEK